MEENNTLLEVRDLQQYFPVAGRRGAFVRAVDGVSFTVREGETFGLVGESGCGKSTLARTVIRLYQPTGGSVRFEGLDITGLSQQELKRSGFRRRMQMVFQDPYSSLNGRMTVRDALLEPLIANRIGENARERDEMARAALARVNLAPDCLHRYPHEFSGGQRQRVCIARALIVRPRMVICDEAISALDVSIQAQVVNMLGDFQQELGLTYLFIAHDLSMVRYVSPRVGVMYLGRLVELCASEEIYRRTRSWLRAGIGRPWRARCPAPSTRPPGAISTPGVPTPSPSAGRLSPPWRTPAADIWWPATCLTNEPRRETGRFRRYGN